MGGCVGGEGSQEKMALQSLALVLLLVGPTFAQTNSLNTSWPIDEEYMEYLDDQDMLLDGNVRQHNSERCTTETALGVVLIEVLGHVLHVSTFFDEISIRRQFGEQTGERNAQEQHR